jgi:MoaA/NifB/PqqE/SkfB family radical SAM enzyme
MLRDVWNSGCGLLSITGGEPLLRNDIQKIVSGTNQIGYMTSLITNSLLLPKRWQILKDLAVIGISLDTLDEKKYDQICGIKGATKKIKGNIIKYSKLQGELGFKMLINTVLTKDNLSDVESIIEFANENEVAVFFEPVHCFGKAPVLKDNKKYRETIDLITSYKKSRYPVLNSSAYLEIMKEFFPFSCLPFLFPRLYPDGTIFFPCLELKQIGGNLLENSMKEIIELYKNDKFNQNLRNCKHYCMLSCYVEPSLSIVNPLSFLERLKHIFKY